MKIRQQHLDKFNHAETTAVISLYPKQGEIYSAGVSGVASYTKNVVRHLKNKVVVLADIWDQKKQYREDNSLVLRVWHGAQPKMWLQILKALRQLTEVRSLLIHFDFSMYGSIVTSSLILPFLALTRVMGFKTVVVSHHVIKDVRTVAGQVGLGHTFKDKLKALFYNLIFKVFYWVLGKTAQSIVLLEQPLKKRLIGIIPQDKLMVIPHAVDAELSKPTKSQGRSRLGFKTDEAVVMFFGYVNWFKGADFFAQAVREVQELNDQKVRFVMAGGQSATLKNKSYYQQFYNKVLDTVEASPI